MGTSYVVGWKMGSEAHNMKVVDRRGLSVSGLHIFSSSFGNLSPSKQRSVLEFWIKIVKLKLFIKINKCLVFTTI